MMEMPLKKGIPIQNGIWKLLDMTALQIMLEKYYLLDFSGVYFSHTSIAHSEYRIAVGTKI